MAEIHEQTDGTWLTGEHSYATLTKAIDHALAVDRGPATVHRLDGTSQQIPAARNNTPAAPLVHQTSTVPEQPAIPRGPSPALGMLEDAPLRHGQGTETEVAPGPPEPQTGHLLDEQAEGQEKPQTIRDTPVPPAQVPPRLAQASPSQHDLGLAEDAPNRLEQSPDNSPGPLESPAKPSAPPANDTTPETATPHTDTQPSRLAAAATRHAKPETTRKLPYAKRVRKAAPKAAEQAKAPRPRWLGPWAAVGAGAVLTGIIAAAVGLATTAPSPAAPSPSWTAVWETQPATGNADASNTVAGPGLIASTGQGATAYYRTSDGSYIGSALAPAKPAWATGSAVLVDATPDTVPRGQQPTSSGTVTTKDKVIPFSQAPGLLVDRGTEPMLYTVHAAGVWNGTSWQSIKAPDPALSPVAATAHTILWSGPGLELTVTGLDGRKKGTIELQTPDGCTKPTAWAWATETTSALVWACHDGARLLAYANDTGRTLAATSVPQGTVFARAGGTVVSNAPGTPTRVWDTSAAPTQSPEACKAPVRSAGQLWCDTGHGYTDNNTTLPPGITPLPSETDGPLPATRDGKATALTLTNH